MWQYRRSIIFNYYYTCGSTAEVSYIINTTHVGVPPQYYI